MVAIGPSVEEDESKLWNLVEFKTWGGNLRRAGASYEEMLDEEESKIVDKASHG